MKNEKIFTTGGADFLSKNSVNNLGALKTQVQHFVGENVAWEKVTTN